MKNCKLAIIVSMVAKISNQFHFKNLKKIKFGSNAFCNCSQLEYYFINLYSKNIIEELYIGDYCFSECKSLSSIRFLRVQNAKIE